MPSTIILGKKKKATGQGSGSSRARARTQARMAATPPGSTTAAKYENLDAAESDYREEGEHREPLATPEYRKEEWSYTDAQSGSNWTSTATCFYIKLTHRKVNLPPGGSRALRDRRALTTRAKPRGTGSGKGRKASR